MFALLGEIPFQVVGSPETFHESRGYDYAEHRVIQTRPRLQWLADDLMTIRLEMLLHRSFTEPSASLLILREAASAHAALPLVFGNGDFRGYFVITRIDTVSRQLSGSGDLFAATVRLSLCESPVEFDPSAPPFPSFLPIAIVAAAAVINAPARASTGVSALAALAAPLGTRRCVAASGRCSCFHHSQESAMSNPQFIKHISSNGDRWDLLAWNYYGDATLFGPIVMANPGIPIEPVLAMGWTVVIPVLEKATVITAGLPPWKRSRPA